MPSALSHYQGLRAPSNSPLGHVPPRYGCAVEPEVDYLNGEDPLAYVDSTELRRHVTTGRRAMGYAIRNPRQGSSRTPRTASGCNGTAVGASAACRRRFDVLPRQQRRLRRAARLCRRLGIDMMRRVRERYKGVPVRPDSGGVKWISPRSE